MPDSHEKLDSLSTPSSSEKVQSGPKLSGNADVKKGAESVIGAVTEAGDNAEDGAESADGKVSETQGEDKSKQGQTGSGGKATMSAEEIEQLKAKLLASAPAPAKMVSQIERALGKEQAKLESEYSDLAAHPQKNPNRFVVVVAKLRKINTHLESLINASYEYIKHLWLKIVHDL